MKKRILYGLTVLSCFGAISANIAAADNDAAAATSGKKITEGEKAEKAEKAEDYTKGFSKFYKFGLPEVKDYEFYHLQIINSSILNNIGGFSNNGMSGNAWKISGDDKTNAKFIIRESSEVEVYNLQKFIQDKQKKSKDQSISIDFQSTYTLEKLLANWNKVNLNKEAEKLIKYLEEKSEKENNYWINNQIGRLLLFAVHLNEKGLKKEANKIAELLFKIKENKREVIIEALNTIADSKYLTTLNNFLQTGNWETFQKEISELIKKYKRAWKDKAGVEKLEEIITKQLSEKDSENFFADFNEKDKNLIQALEKEKLPSIKTSIWIIPGVTVEKLILNYKDNKNKALEEILKNKMKSVPLLISLLGSKRLLKHSKTNFMVTSSYFSGYFSHFSFSSSSESSDDIFNKMQRPMTEDEFAKYMLKAIIFDKDSEGNEDRWENNNISKLDSDEFGETVQEWYQENKDKSISEILIAYIKYGNKSQKQFATEYILAKKLKDTYSAIETYLLSDESEGDDMDVDSIDVPQEKQELAVKYVSERGKAAADFVKQFIEKLDPYGELRKEKKSDDPSVKQTLEEKNKELQNKEKLNLIKRLQSLISPESVEDILNDLLGLKNDKTVPIDRIQALKDKLKSSTKKGDEKIKLILENCLKIVNENKNIKLIPYYMNALSSNLKGEKLNRQTFFFVEEPTVEPEKEKINPKENVLLWKKLFNLKTYINTKDNENNYSLGNLAKIAYNVIYNNSNERMAYYNLVSLGKKYSELLDKRIAESMSGTQGDKLTKDFDIQKTPEMKKKAEQIKEKVVEKLKSSKNILKTVKSLSLKELFPAFDYFSNNKELSKQCATEANKITEIITDNIPECEKFKELQGKTLKASDIENIKDFLINSAKKGKNIIVKIDRKPVLDGVTISFALDSKNENTGNTEDKYIIAYFSVKNYGYFSATWPLLEKSNSQEIKNENNSDDETDDLFGEMESEINEEINNENTEAQKELNKALKDFESGKANTLTSGLIYLKVDSK